MPYITSVERIGIEKPMQQGESVLLMRHFGPSGADTQARLKTVAAEQWIENMPNAAKLENIFKDHWQFRQP